MARKILVTAALPYASGQIHLGNLLEMVQTDIWVRYQRHSAPTARLSAPPTRTALQRC